MQIPIFQFLACRQGRDCGQQAQDLCDARRLASVIEEHDVVVLPQLQR
jgi:hypothetical protein